MDEAQATLLAAFAGAGVGAWLSLLFARRQAFEQALGQRYAERRLEIIERLNVLLSEVGDLEAERAGADLPNQTRGAGAVYADLDSMVNQARLYLDGAVLRPFESMLSWLHEEAMSGGHTRNLFPDEVSFAEVRVFLAESVEGRHQAATAGWLRRTTARLRRSMTREPKRLSPGKQQAE